MANWQGRLGGVDKIELQNRMDEEFSLVWLICGLSVQTGGPSVQQ